VGEAIVRYRRAPPGLLLAGQHVRADECGLLACKNVLTVSALAHEECRPIGEPEVNGGRLGGG
jgi:hypothetical protein